MSERERVIVITGASSGIGAVAAVRLAEAGNRVAVVGRNRVRTQQIARQARGDAFVADFDRLDEVRELAAALLAHYNRIDVLLNNAGGLMTRREVTLDGHERTIQSNHLAPFLLTRLLLARLIASAADAPVRVIGTGSTANRMSDLRVDDLDWAHRPYRGGWRAYGTAKLADILFAQELAERMTGTGVSAYAVHPGVVDTRFGASSPSVRAAQALTLGHYGISPGAGAGPLIALAAPATVPYPSGIYFDRYRPFGQITPKAANPQLRRDLWRVSAAAVGLPDELTAELGGS